MLVLSVARRPGARVVRLFVYYTTQVAVRFVCNGARRGCPGAREPFANRGYGGEHGRGRRIVAGVVGTLTLADTEQQLATCCIC